MSFIGTNRHEYDNSAKVVDCKTVQDSASGRAELDVSCSSTICVICQQGQGAMHYVQAVPCTVCNVQRMCCVSCVIVHAVSMCHVLSACGIGMCHV